MSLTKNYIVQRARALMALMSPLCGERATGSIVAKATGGDVVVPRNSYLMRLDDGTLMPHYLYKVGPNPATLQTNGTGGDWTVTSAGTTLGALSNIGGARFNLKAGTKLQWSPPIAGLEPLATVAAGGFTGGTTGDIQAMSFYEELGPDTQGVFEGELGHFPAVVIAWVESSPSDGKSLGLRRGGSRKGRGQMIWFERYQLNIVATKAQSDPTRRIEGLDLVEDISAMLSDQTVNEDRESLTVTGGIEINGRRLFNRSPKAYIYQITLRLSRTQTRRDTRTFNPWLRTRMQVPLAADPPLAEKDLLDHEWEQEHPDNEDP